jgi:hypothetical protein
MNKKSYNGPFSRNLDQVKHAVYLDPSCIYTKSTLEEWHRLYALSPLEHAIYYNYPLSIIKFLLRCGSYVNLQFLTYTQNWIIRRNIIQHIPSIVSNVDGIRNIYTKAPKKEKIWIDSFLKNREIFVKEITPQLLAKVSETYGIPPIQIKPGFTVPGRQGYVEAFADMIALGGQELFMREESLYAPAPAPAAAVQEEYVYVEQLVEEKPKASKYYNHPRWPSPLPKVFLQHICRLATLRKSINIKISHLFTEAGIEGKVTHDNCLAYLAWKINISLDALLEHYPGNINLLLFGKDGIKMRGIHTN